MVDDWNLDGCRQAGLDYFDGLDPEWRKKRGGYPVPHMEKITESGDVWWTKP